MKETILQSTLRELQTILASPRLWLVFAASVILFTATGPFGTLEALALPARLGYWLIVQSLTWLVALLFVVFFNAALERHVAHALPRMLVGAALSALPMGLVLLIVNAGLRNAPVSMAELVSDVLTALPIALVMCLLSWLALDGSSPDEPAAPEPALDAPHPAAPARPALLDRLPAEKRGALVRLEVQDHYVLVVTTRGREMLLMRLADAMRETAPAEGRQVHRSHWAARHGAEALERESGKNGRLFLRMTDGMKVPVSRANAAAVKAWPE